MRKANILYIEDEQPLGKIVSDTLEIEGYTVLWESDGANVLPHLSGFIPDICIIDIMLPGIDGYSLCRTIRGMLPGVPVIFLTAKSETSDLLRGFEAGGTDYIKKPFSIEELVARIENQLKLSGNLNNTDVMSAGISIGSMMLYPSRYELVTSGGIVKLSNRDMQVLQILNANRNQVVSRKDMLLSIWGDDSYFNSRNLDVYIRKLRTYLKGDKGIEIITLKGNGYIFTVPS